MQKNRMEETSEPEKTLPMEEAICKIPISSARQRVSDEGKRRKEGKSPLSKTGLFSLRKRKDVDSRIEKLRDKLRPGDVLFAGEEESLHLLEEEYELKKQFAEGGQGALFRGFDRKLRRLVAIKSLHANLPDSERQRRLFLTEARVTAQLDHPAIVPIYTLNTDRQNGLQLAMKLINGETFKAYLEQVATHYRLDGIHSFDETKSLRYRLEIFLKVCDALEYAHNRNVMHGDLKPANIMIGEYHETYIMDWGIAGRIRDKDGNPMKHELAGTPRYLAPEAIAREAYDQRADIFAMGAILFEAVLLKPAFTGSSVEEVTSKIVAGETEALEHRFGAHVDGDLKAIIRKAMALDPDQRYRQIRDLSTDLRRYLMGFEVSAKRDNPLMKVIRWCYLHRQVTLILLLIALLLGMGALSHTLYQNYRFSEQMRERENALSIAYSVCSLAGYRLDEQFLRLDQMTSFLAADLQFLLDYDRHESPAASSNFHVPFHSVTEMRSKRFPTMIHSEFHRGTIDPTALVFNTAEDTNRKRIRKRLSTIARFIPRLLQIILASPADAKTITGSLEERKAAAFRDGTPIIRVLFGFSDGLYLAYPASGAFPEKYDPRTRPWYRSVEEDKNRTTVWTPPYIDSIPELGLVISCSTCLPGRKGSGNGVCAIDISLAELIEELRSAGNRGSYVEEKAIVDNSGRIIVSTTADFAESEMRRYHSADETVTFASLDNPGLLSEMNRRKFGIVVTTDKRGAEVVYAFCHIRSVNWFYVERMNVAQLLEHCRSSR